MQKVITLLSVLSLCSVLIAQQQPAAPLPAGGGAHEPHAIGKLTEEQRLRMTNINLAEYAFQSDVRSAKAEAQVAAQKAQTLDGQLQGHLEKLEKQREDLKAELAAQNPGWHWQDAQNPGDSEGLVKDPPPQTAAAPAPAKK